MHVTNHINMRSSKRNLRFYLHFTVFIMHANLAQNSRNLREDYEIYDGCKKVSAVLS